MVIEAWKMARGGPVPPGAEIRSVEDGLPQVYDHLHDTWVYFEPGDWIIKGIQGEFYPCKADVFEQSYEGVSHALL